MKLSLPGANFWASLRKKGWRFVLVESQISFFPVVIALILAAMSYWLAIVANPPEDDKSGRYRHDPDVVAKRLTVKTYSQLGLKKDTLNAQGAEHYPDDETTKLIKPNLIHVNNGNVPSTTVKSEEAFINSDQSEVELVGNVVGYRPAYNGRESVTFNTSQIIIFTDEERAETKHRVKVYQGKDWMAGTGFDLDNVTQVYNFHSHVEAMRYPTAKLAR